MPTTKITYGDTVQVLQEAPHQFRPDKLGAICGIREVNKVKDSADIPGASEGRLLYLVEFGDGIAIEIPELFVQKAA